MSIYFLRTKYYNKHSHQLPNHHSNKTSCYSQPNTAQSDTKFTNRSSLVDIIDHKIYFSYGSKAPYLNDKEYITHQKQTLDKKLIQKQQVVVIFF